VLAYCRRMVKRNYGLVILAAVLFVLVSLVVHMAGAMLMLDFYTDPQFFPVWSPLMMPSGGSGAPPASFVVYSLIFSFVVGMALAAVFLEIRHSLDNASVLRTGTHFGVLMFLMSVVPATLALLLLINIPALLVVEWAFESLVIYFAAGIAFARIFPRSNFILVPEPKAL